MVALKRKQLTEEEEEVVASSNVLEQGDSRALKLLKRAEEEEEGGDQSEGESIEYGSDHEEEKEEEGGAGGDESSQQGKNDASMNPLYKVPTNEEMVALKETENLFKSNLFRLQLEEMISEVKVDCSKQKRLEKFLFEIKSVLDGLEEQEECEVNIKEGFSETSIPAAHKNAPVFNFKFIPPQKVNLVGSFMLKAVCKSDLNVDMEVVMPSDCFLAKDHLNYRYYYKKSAYLAVLFRVLNNSGICKKVEYSYFNGNVLKPIIVITPGDDVKSKFQIRLFLTIDEQVFKLAKLGPSRNNVRIHKFMEQVYEKHVEPTDPEKEPATPRYNASIIADMKLSSHLKMTHRNMKQCESFVDAIMLCKVWLQQRGFKQTKGGVDGYLMTMVMNYLFSIRKLSRNMSCYQLFKMTLHFIANNNLCENGIAFNMNACSDNSLESFHRVSDCVFVDECGVFNIFATVTEGAYLDLMSEAALTTKCLDEQESDNFNTIFMTKKPVFEKFDHVLKISDYPVIDSYRGKFNKQMVDFAGDYASFVSSYSCKLLKKGLGDRSQFVRTFIVGKSASMDIQSCVKLFKEGEIEIVIKANLDNHRRLIDQGPSAEDKNACESFRSFWGNKSELRRFKDGSILEACVWQRPVSQRHMIVDDIVEHVLERHMNISGESVRSFGDIMDRFIKKNVRGNTESDFNQESFHIVHAANELMKSIRELRELPLSVANVQSTSAALRYCEVFANEKIDEEQLLEKNMWVPTVDIICEFESSSKWPDDLEAIENMKCALYVKMGELLKKADKEGELITSVTKNFLDVFREGYVFRVFIHHERERFLLKELVQEAENEPKKKRALSGLFWNDLAQYERKFIYEPKHTSYVHALQLKYPAFGPTVRLVKRWLSAHMLLDFLSSEVVEIIVAQTFINTSLYEPASNTLGGLLRFWSFLANFNWRENPLVANFDHEISASKIAEIGRKVSDLCNSSHSGMFIVTPYDQEESVWTKSQTSSLFLRRAIRFCEKSHATLLKLLDGPSKCLKSTLKGFFVTPTDGFDVVISLKKSCLPRYQQNLNATKDSLEQVAKSKFQNLGPKSIEDALTYGNFDPARIFKRELEAKYADIALFFQDVYGGDSIYVSFKPKAREEASFSAFDPRLTISSGQNSGKVTLNVKAVLQDFFIVGEGLVEDVSLL
eukprot:Nk52_evm4s337 gene=Nk52_evmTU4s337